MATEGQKGKSDQAGGGAQAKVGPIRSRKGREKVPKRYLFGPKRSSKRYLFDRKGPEKVPFRDLFGTFSGKNDLFGQFCKKYPGTPICIKSWFWGFLDTPKLILMVVWPIRVE